MSRARSFAAFLLISLPWAAHAALPERPDGYVTDRAGVVGDAAEAALNGLLADLERKTGAQMAVVTVPSLDGETVDAAAEALFRRWGIGRREQDDGILLLVSTGDRRARIEVGYGLEGLIPDARAGRILDEVAVPRFRTGNYEGGVIAAAIAVATRVAQDKGVTLSVPASAGRAARPEKQAPGWLVFLIMVAAVWIFMKNPWLFLLLLSGGGRRGGGGGFGGFGGFGGGGSGGGGASRGW